MYARRDTHIQSPLNKYFYDGVIFFQFFTTLSSVMFVITV